MDEKVTSNKQNVLRNEQKTCNEQKVTSNEQWTKSSTSSEFSFRVKSKRIFIINTINTHLMMIVLIKLLMSIKLSAIMEYKWDINYVQTIPALIQQKVLRKILEKVFITTKCTQRKTLHTLKADVFELTENKNIEKLFSKYDLFSLDQANLGSDPSQILIIQYPISTAFLSP